MNLDSESLYELIVAAALASVFVGCLYRASCALCFVDAIVFAVVELIIRRQRGSWQVILYYWQALAILALLCSISYDSLEVLLLSLLALVTFALLFYNGVLLPLFLVPQLSIQFVVMVAVSAFVFLLLCACLPSTSLKCLWKFFSENSCPLHDAHGG